MKLLRERGFEIRPERAGGAVAQLGGRHCLAQLARAPLSLRALSAVGEVMFDLEVANEIQFAVNERV
jgi:hypothetical protein